MLDISQGLRQLASRTSRRSILARMGTGLISAATFAVIARPADAKGPVPPVRPDSECCPGGGNCSLCGGCGSPSIPCGSQDQGCCSGPCVGPFCEGTGGTCPSETADGRWWYCCKPEGLYICQDCCVGGTRQCTSKGLIGSC